MKKLALVLGSLLVVGSVASAKEVMPAPTPAPEKVVDMLKNQLLFTETEKLLLLGDQMDQLMFNTDGMEKLKTKLNLKTQIKIGQTQKIM